MSKKKVLDYDPKTGFGNFAEIMNKNYALDMARNGVNMPANNMAGAPLESGTLGGTQAQSGMLKVDTATPSLAEAVGVTEDPVATDTETGTVTGTDASTGADTGAVSGVTSDLTGSTAQPILSVSGYKSDFGTFAEWMAKNGYDPDRDYDEKKAALEYDYKTSSATYGQRAEELSQMGLSNSGVSDIYQLGEFNSYLQQQRQIANERIAEKKKYKQEYNTLYQQNQNALKLDNANAYNFGLSLYDGKNIDFVSQQLTQQGYDAGVVEQAVQSLAALDVNTLPVVKKQNAARDEKIQNAVEYWLQTGYNSNNADNIRALYAAQEDWDQADIEKLISQLDAYSATTTDALVEEGLAAFNAANPNFVYDGSETAKETIRQTLGSTYEKVFDKIFEKMDSNRAGLADAAVTDAVSKETGTVTIDELDSAFASISESYDKDSQEYKDQQDTVSKKIAATVTWALEEKNIGKDEVGAAFGYTAEEWSKLDDGSRETEILETIGQCVKNGSMKQETYNEYVTDWLNSELDLYIKEDKKNAQATGFRDAGSVVYTLMEWKDEGYMTEDDYKNRIQNVCEKMKFTEGKTWDGYNEIRWYDTVPGAEGSVDIINFKHQKDLSEDVYNNNLKNAKYYTTNNVYAKIVAYNGDLYYIYNSSPKAGQDSFAYENVDTVYKVDPIIDWSFEGDGIGTAYDYEKIGMYQILVHMLSSKEDKLWHTGHQR